MFCYARSISNIFRFFLGNIEKCPFTYWFNGRWFLQIVDIGNFNMKLNGRWFPQTVDHQPRWLSGRRRSHVHSLMIARRSLWPEKLGSNPGQGSKGINFSGWHGLDVSITVTKRR